MQKTTKHIKHREEEGLRKTSRHTTRLSRDAEGL
jgi:hypothetical protein